MGVDQFDASTPILNNQTYKPKNSKTQKPNKVKKSKPLNSNDNSIFHTIKVNPCPRPGLQIYESSSLAADLAAFIQDLAAKCSLSFSRSRPAASSSATPAKA